METPAAGDARLATGLRLGLEEAYELLVTRFQQPVYNLVYRLMSDPGDASDVVQEVFLKVFRNIGTFRSESSLKTWIYRIAVNEVHNYRRWFFRHRRQEVMLEDESEGGKNFSETVPDRGRSPYDYALDGEKRVMIEDALARINPDVSHRGGAARYRGLELRRNCRHSEYFPWDREVPDHAGARGDAPSIRGPAGAGTGAGVGSRGGLN